MTPSPYEIAKSVSEQINAAHAKWLADQNGGGRWKSNRASGLDDVCLRRVYLWRTAGELAAPVDADLQAIFSEGNIQEPLVRRHLSELGFEIVKAGVEADWPQYQISGHIDGILSRDGVDLVAEVKTVSDNGWRAIKTELDLISERGWYRKWYGQMQIYLFLLEKEAGIFILKRKQAYQFRAIPIELNYDYGEKMIQKAESVNSAIKSGEAPAFLDNAAECARCPFFARACNPPMEFADGLRTVSDSELEEDLLRLESLEASADEYSEISARTKDRFKASGKGSYQAGEWLISVTEKPMNRVDTKAMPPEEKAKYTVAGVSQTVSWKRIIK